MRTCFAVTTAFGRRFASTATNVSGVPAAYAAHASAVYTTWAELNVTGRGRLETIAATNDGKTSYGSLRNTMSAPAATSVQPLKQVVAKAKTIADVAQGVEAALYQVRKLEKERSELQLHMWNLKDSIYLGIGTPEVIAAHKKELAATTVQHDANRKANKEYCAKLFETSSFNDVINLFRIAGDRCEHARSYAETLLDDMALVGVAFDDATKLLLKNVVFGDQPHEDSNLLFTFVENPERGEVSLAPAAAGDLTAIANEALVTIGRRHTTPVTEHLKLQSTVTHPMLQRSPE